MCTRNIWGTSKMQWLFLPCHHFQWATSHSASLFLFKNAGGLGQHYSSLKRYHGHSKSYKRKLLIGFTYNFKGLVHCHGGSRQIWLENLLRVLHLDLMTAGGERLWALTWAFRPTPSDFLQQGHTTSSFQICHSLVTNYSSLWAYGGHSYSNHGTWQI